MQQQQQSICAPSCDWTKFKISHLGFLSHPARCGCWSRSALYHTVSTSPSNVVVPGLCVVYYDTVNYLLSLLRFLKSVVLDMKSGTRGVMKPREKYHSLSTKGVLPAACAVDSLGKKGGEPENWNVTIHSARADCLFEIVWFGRATGCRCKGRPFSEAMIKLL